jgi:competence protein ComEA
LAALVIGAVGWLVIYAALHGNVAAPKTSGRAETTPARLDLNQANRAELELLPGVGPQVAQRIEAYRILYGPFPNVDELRKVPGVGPQLLERVRPHVMVSGAATSSAPSAAVSASPKSAARAVESAPIDINTASAAELEQLPAIGPKLAQRIMEVRAGSPFTSVDDLRRVPGIGPKTLEKLRPHVRVP